MNIRYRAQALADIDEIYSYLRERSPSGAFNVLRAIYAGIHLIAERPGAWPQTTTRQSE
jgi:toxin ParE1/3/4